MSRVTLAGEVMRERGLEFVGRSLEANPVALPVIYSCEAFMATTQEAVMSALRECYDPEIPVNIVDLGLIYEVRIDPVPAEAGEGETVEVDMTLTAPGCPSSGYISQSVKQRLEQMPGVRAATVNVVWSPPWGPERISAEGKKKLGIE